LFLNEKDPKKKKKIKLENIINYKPNGLFYKASEKYLNKTNYSFNNELI